MKKFKIFVPIFLAITIVYTSLSGLTSTAENISDKVLRLHILANSDSSEDQSIKLQLRDYFLENSRDIFTGDNIEENIEIADNNIDYIQKLCNDYLEQYNQSASVSLTNEYFSTRVYDDFTLPAGNYNTIKIEIGEGRGHNWWCIVFPSVCLSSCSATMDEYLTDDELELVNSGYSPKFKVIEIYEQIKDRLKK